MISVLMGVHRLDEYVYPAIESILEQRDIDLELIIVANGDDFLSIEKELKDKYKNHPKVNILSTPIGQLAHALNIGLSNAKYDYIARMDSDDISHPHRLSKQIKYLKEKDLDLVGTNVNLIDKDGRGLGVSKLPGRKKINFSLLYRSTFIHPTVLSKKEVLIKARGYNSGFNSEDYDLWLRLRRGNIKWDNMDERLLDYRIHDSSSQGSILGYAEVAGYMVRELILARNPLWVLPVFIAFFKSIFRSKKR